MTNDIEQKTALSILHIYRAASATWRKGSSPDLCGDRGDMMLLWAEQTREMMEKERRMAFTVVYLMRVSRFEIRDVLENTD